MRESFQSYCERMKLDRLLKQWDTASNLPLTPEQISYGSNRKVWWQCEKGHHWQAAVYTRTGSGTGCPVCTGRVPLAGETDLATLHPDLARQWHPTKNGPLLPSQVTPSCKRRVWWLCAEGHVWKAAIYSRAGKQRRGCPVCAGVVNGKRRERYEKMLTEVREVMEV